MRSYTFLDYVVNTENGMADADYSGGVLGAYNSEKGWSDKCVSSFWSQLVGRYQRMDGYSGRIDSIVLEYCISLIMTQGILQQLWHIPAGLVVWPLGLLLSRVIPYFWASINGGGGVPVVPQHPI